MVTELESSYEKLNEDFAVCNERCTDLEDRLYHEKKLRKTVERELRELEGSVKKGEKHELDGSCSGYSDSSSLSSEEECKSRSKTERSRRKPREKFNRGRQERSSDEGEKWKQSVTSKVMPSDERQRSRSSRHKRKSDEDCYVENNLVPSPTRSRKQEHQEEETNIHYERAVRYLEEYCNDRIVQYERDDWRCSESETEPEREVQDAEVGPEEDRDQEEIVPQAPPRLADKGKKICYAFKDKGACLTQDCKFLHFNPNLSYPSFTGKMPDEPSHYERGHGQPKGKGSRSRPDGQFPYGYQKRGPYKPKNGLNSTKKPK